MALAVVLDTNVLVSALLRPASAPAAAFRTATRHDRPISTLALMAEFERVLRRPKFDVYASLEERMIFLSAVAKLTQIVTETESVAICRDPADDRVLSAALSGGADTIVTGDQDLLILGTFRSVRVKTPAEYVRSFAHPIS